MQVCATFVNQLLPIGNLKIIPLCVNSRKWYERGKIKGRRGAGDLDFTW